MKLGFIFECGPDGGDMKVFRHLCKAILARQNIAWDEKKDFDFEPLESKPKLIKDCAKAVKRLRSAGCEKIFIVWDLYPAWRIDGEKPCRHEDKLAIKAALAAQQIAPEDVVFLCIEEELEAWLIADGRALNAYFSKPYRKVDAIGDQKKPDIVSDPKGVLMGYFKQYKGGTKYEANMHAEQIVRLLPDFQRIRKSESFSRFHQKLTTKEVK